MDSLCCNFDLKQRNKSISISTVKQVKAVQEKKMFSPIHSNLRIFWDSNPSPAWKGAMILGERTDCTFTSIGLQFLHSQKATQYRRVRKGRKILRNIGEKNTIFHILCTTLWCGIIFQVWTDTRIMRHRHKH